MTLPNFYILGAQKSGTTWLTSMLRQHPEIFIPRQKEINYFNRVENFSLGREWYENHFNDHGNATAIGEATPEYLGVNLTQETAKVVDRIKALTPNARFIISLRNPVTRAVSGLLHDMRQGRMSAWSNLDTEFDLLFSRRHPCHHVLAFGHYGEQIRSFLRHFPVHRFKFIIYEQDILSNRRETLRCLCQFLRVQTDFAFQHVDVRINPAIQTRMGMVLAQLPFHKIHTRGSALGRFLGWKFERFGLGKQLPISDDTRRRLYRYYVADRKELSQIVGHDLEIWDTDKLNL